MRMARPIGLALASMMFAASSAFAQTADRSAAPPGPRLRLTGKATRDVRPDYASVTVGVTHKAATAAAAIDQTSTGTAKVIDDARAFGIEPRDLQTSFIALEPSTRSVRDPGGNTEQRPDGYVASNAVTIRIRDFGRLGAFLRKVVDGGASTIDGIEFEVADRRKLERDALADAIRDARAQAEAIAEAAGVKLGRLEEIRTGPSGEPQVRRRYDSGAVRAKAAPPVPVEAGSLAVSAEVEVIFGLEPV